jgi:hypothetical protein
MMKAETHHPDAQINRLADDAAVEVSGGFL